MDLVDRGTADERRNWKGIHRRPWFAGLRHGVHRRPVRPASVLGPLAAVFVTAAVGAFALSDIGVPAAGPQPVVLPGICSDCAGTPLPTPAPTVGRSTEHASRSTARTPRPTRSPTKPPPPLMAPAPDTSPSMTVCPPPLPPTKPSKSKKPKGKPSPSQEAEGFDDRR